MRARGAEFFGVDIAQHHDLEEGELLRRHVRRDISDRSAAVRCAIRPGEEDHRRNLPLREQGAAEEFVLPARDALHVEEAVARIDHLHGERVLVVLLVLLAGQRRHEHAVVKEADLRVLELEGQLALAALIGNLRGLFGAQLAVLKDLHGDRRAARALAGDFHFELGFPPHRDPARSRDGIDAQIGLLLPAAGRLEAHGVDGKRALGAGPVVERLARIRAIAEQEQAGDIQAGGAVGDLLEGIAQARGGAVRLEGRDFGRRGGFRRPRRRKGKSPRRTRRRAPAARGASAPPARWPSGWGRLWKG